MRRRGGWIFLVGILLALPVYGQPRPNWPRSVTIGSASIGGVYYVVAGGYAKVIQEKMGISASNRVTGGPIQNIQLVHAKQIELGLTTMGPAYEALRGIGWAQGTRYDSIRFTWPMYTSFAHWITRADSPIRSVADLNGKVVDLGPRGGSAEFVGHKVFSLFGIRPARVVNLSFAEGANALRDGLVDANFGVIGVPVPAWLELSITRPVRFFGFTPEQIQRLTATYPYLASAAIRAHVYRGQDYVIRTVQMWNAAFVHKDMPEDFVYELTKTIFDNQELLEQVHPTGAETRPVNIYYIAGPLHPGALRYYRERGVRLRPEHQPPH
ncbi:MAG: TAXI family TRAP transporter solute-binding subunit [Armatimonadetes bacterium]|nr:TAXI family TRAP transporter solute-binding subunit [Armatimonadota bacterium]MDW8152654.1 TAXI family TRAP transporter solute-binding subunit [Armatimonadota bacterium]